MINEYGVFETNPMPSGYHDEDLEYINWEILKTMTQTIVAERIRFVSNPGFPWWDLSYFHVRIDGKRYGIIGTPFYQIGKKTFKTDLYKILKDEGIFIKDFFASISKMQ